MAATTTTAKSTAKKHKTFTKHAKARSKSTTRRGVTQARRGYR